MSLFDALISYSQKEVRSSKYIQNKSQDFQLQNAETCGFYRLFLLGHIFSVDKM